MISTGLSALRGTPSIIPVTPREHADTESASGRLKPKMPLHQRILRAAIPAQRRERRILDRITIFSDMRRIGQMKKPGGAVDAADALASEHCRKVVVITGFNVDKTEDGHAIPETDGPPGTAALVNALLNTGKEVVILTDSPNKKVVQAALGVIDPEAVGKADVVTFDEKDSEQADRLAGALLKELDPDAVVSIEVPGRNARGSDGKFLNMRGVDVSDINSRRDAFFIAAYKSGVRTIGIFDGGNETGARTRKVQRVLNRANLAARISAHVQVAEARHPGTGAPVSARLGAYMRAFLTRRVPEGTSMASTVPSHYPVTSSTSNTGAVGVAAALLARYKKLDKLHTPAQEEKMIAVAIENGAVDGVTKQSELGKIVDGNVTGVDGIAARTHAGIVDLVRREASRLPQTHELVEAPDNGR